jgi:AAA family ATP:ADP antiporter
MTALLLMANIFTLLTAYYIIKPVRDALILGESSAEIKSYASAAQAVLLVFIIPLYSSIARRVNRLWLVNGVTIFFISNLVLFFCVGTGRCQTRRHLLSLGWIVQRPDHRPILGFSE